MLSRSCHSHFPVCRAMIKQVQLNDLAQTWAGRSPHLVMRVSFEGRSLVVADALATSGASKITCFASTGRSDLAERNLARLRAASESADVRELDVDEPLRAAEELYRFFSEEMSRSGLRDLVIDVTSFRREELLMILALLKSLGPGTNTGSDVVYVAAESMAETLSGRVSNYRSVIGYAGRMYPSRPTRLVVLMGFEFDRARSIIENYEPRSLILWKGRLSQSINSELGILNDQFHKELQSQYNNVESVFEFSARDPATVIVELEAAIGLDDASNVIIAPLHTKLSTLGAGLFALRHEQVQIC